MNCQANPGEVAFKVMSRVRNVESRRRALNQICGSCSSTRSCEAIACDSFDCPVQWDRIAVQKERVEVEEILSLSL
jgi:DNA polymerase zeta